MPAPPPESEPAMVSALKDAGVMVYGSLEERVQRIRGRLTAPARPSSG
jgi:hypothetical protein